MRCNVFLRHAQSGTEVGLLLPLDGCWLGHLDGGENVERDGQSDIVLVMFHQTSVFEIRMELRSACRSLSLCRDDVAVWRLLPTFRPHQVQMSSTTSLVVSSSS